MAYPHNLLISRLSKSPNSMNFCINSVFSSHALSWEKARGSSGMIFMGVKLLGELCSLRALRYWKRYPGEVFVYHFS